MRIVVAGMFDGMVAPSLVYQGAAILSSLCGGCDSVVHIGRSDVEHVTDAALAHAVREPSRDRGLRGTGVYGYEGAAPAEPIEVGAEVLGGHALEARHERIEGRVDGVDPIDGPLGAVLGIIGRMSGDLELGEDVHIGGRLVRRHDGTGRDAASQHIHGAPSRQDAPPRYLEERLVRVVHAGHHADLLARQAALVYLLAAMPGGTGHRERTLGVVALERFWEIGLVELAAAAPLDPERGGSRPKGTR